MGGGSSDKQPQPQPQVGQMLTLNDMISPDQNRTRFIQISNADINKVAETAPGLRVSVPPGGVPKPRAVLRTIRKSILPPSSSSAQPEQQQQPQPQMSEVVKDYVNSGEFIKLHSKKTLEELSEAEKKTVVRKRLRKFTKQYNKACFDAITNNFENAVVQLNKEQWSYRHQFAELLTVSGAEARLHHSVHGFIVSLVPRRPMAMRRDHLIRERRRKRAEEEAAAAVAAKSKGKEEANDKGKEEEDEDDEDDEEYEEEDDSDGYGKAF